MQDGILTGLALVLIAPFALILAWWKAAPPLILAGLGIIVLAEIALMATAFVEDRQDVQEGA